jgi:hypothetical protein
MVRSCKATSMNEFFNILLAKARTRARGKYGAEECAAVALPSADDRIRFPDQVEAMARGPIGCLHDAKVRCRVGRFSQTASRATAALERQNLEA